LGVGFLHADLGRPRDPRRNIRAVRSAVPRVSPIPAVRAGQRDEGDRMKRGIAVEYASEQALLEAIRAVRAKGLDTLEVYSPVPSDAIDSALGAPRSPLAVAAGAGGLFGAIGGYFLQ